MWLTTTCARPASWPLLSLSLPFAVSALYVFLDVAKALFVFFALCSCSWHAHDVFALCSRYRRISFASFVRFVRFSVIRAGPRRGRYRPRIVAATGSDHRVVLRLFRTTRCCNIHVCSVAPSRPSSSP